MGRYESRRSVMIHDIVCSSWLNVTRRSSCRNDIVDMRNSVWTLLAGRRLGGDQDGGGGRTITEAVVSSSTTLPSRSYTELTSTLL